MKRVFELAEELKSNPERVESTQALTFDVTRPRLGLKGSQGLFGSPEWWQNINQGKIPLLFVSGVVLEAYMVGQEESGPNNTVDLRLPDGSVRAVGIYVNDLGDIRLFRVGCKVEIVYALDELKQQPAKDGGVNYSNIALEMAVSLG